MEMAITTSSSCSQIAKTISPETLAKNVTDGLSENPLDNDEFPSV